MTELPADAPEHRQRRWHEAHDRLYDAACELFMQSGYIGTSMEEIADRAHMVRKTAFNHFPRKRDFINEWGRRRREQVLSALSPELMSDASIEVVLRHYFAELSAVNLEQRALTICMSAGWREQGGPFDTDPHELLDVFRGFLTDAKERGEIAASVDVAQMGTVLYSSYFGILYEWCKGSESEPPFDLKVAYARMLDVIWAGLHAQSGWS
ncbi:TetR/AcrR family transcriptional regulator [Microbacterium terregens]|uniref:TetR/AcrR family transcriptional regulator n=1 Tax=Microbacterium terregens TaxID=69363 RepID=A0ABV5SYZ8_9MICO